MAAPVPQNSLADRVKLAISVSRITVIGQDDFKHESQGETLIAALGAFGARASGFIYVEPNLPRRPRRPEDLVICHPETGVIFLQVNHSRSVDLRRSASGAVQVVRRNGIVIEPVQQAATCASDIRHAFDREGIPQDDLPLVEWVAAFPLISEQEWLTAFGESPDRTHILLREDISDSSLLRAKIQTLVRQRKKAPPIQLGQVDIVRRAFGDASVVNPQRKMRQLPDETIGAWIEELESRAKNVSPEQQDLSRLEIRGYPRLIRGVAGSGKTVVLANMAATFLERETNSSRGGAGSGIPRVAIVCFNRSLVPFIRKKVEETGREFPRELLVITHFDKLLRGMPFAVTKIPQSEQDHIDRATLYRELLTQQLTDAPHDAEQHRFDAIFVDEAQDLHPSELSLLLTMLRPSTQTGEKNLIIFYDDAQNVYARPRPRWRDHGIDVARGDRAKVMKTCFRNSREIIQLSFNVLMGTRANPGAQQVGRGFVDLDTLQENGLVEQVQGLFDVKFASRDDGPKPHIQVFRNPEAEIDWLVQELRRLICEQHANPHDILVLFETDYVIRGLEAKWSQLPCIPAVQGFHHVYRRARTGGSYLFKDGHVTLATTRSAKGYDSPIVFLIGAGSWDGRDARSRASFYVGATRAKHMLYITGTHNPHSLLEEAQRVDLSLKSVSVQP